LILFVQFVFKKADAALGWFYIRSNLNGLVVEDVGKDISLVVNPKSGRDGQLWKRQANSLVNKNNLALDVKGPIDGDYKNGVILVPWQPHGGNNQKWGYFASRIVGLYDRYALEVEDSKPIAGTKVIGTKRKRNKAQFWTLESYNNDAQGARGSKVLRGQPNGQRCIGKWEGICKDRVLTGCGRGADKGRYICWRQCFRGSVRRCVAKPEAGGYMKCNKGDHNYCASRGSASMECIGNELCQTVDLFEL